MNGYRNLTKRQQEIINLLTNVDFASVEDLMGLCKVSGSTIRRDLDYLSKLKYIERFHGGAKLNGKKHFEIITSNKQYSHWAEKEKIGKKAAEFVEDGDLIGINAGSTVMAFAQNLSLKKNLSIVTSDYEAARMLTNRRDFNVFITGGKVEGEVPGLEGKSSVELIGRFSFAKCFLGVRGLNPVDGLMTSRYEQAIAAQAFIKNSLKVFVITDSSKFSLRTGAIIEPLSKIDVLITDSGLINFPTIYEQILGYPSVELIMV
jgi:DeoR/GlpR family transcriptional regulator of sugar metabolism